MQLQKEWYQDWGDDDDDDDEFEEVHMYGSDFDFSDDIKYSLFSYMRLHLVRDKASHIFKHLKNSEYCRILCSVVCFHILDHASMSFQL